MDFRLNPDFVEYIHDVLVGVLMPFDQPIMPGEHRDRGRIESATWRPFQTAFETEIWPTPAEKAAAVFHSLVCDHCFLNGNKRTGVIGLDLFLAVNGYMAVMPMGEAYELAKTTAQAKMKGIPSDVVMRDLAANFSEVIVQVAVLQQETLGLNPGDVAYGRILRLVERLTQTIDLGLASGIKMNLSVNTPAR